MSRVGGHFSVMDDWEPLALGSSPLAFDEADDDFQDLLQSFGDQFRNADDSDLSPLAELSVIDDEDDNYLTAPIDEGIFDQRLEEDVQQAAVSNAEEKKAEELLQALDDLQIAEENTKTATTVQFRGDGIPPYFYCRPCPPRATQEALLIRQLEEIQEDLDLDLNDNEDEGASFHSTDDGIDNLMSELTLDPNSMLPLTRTSQRPAALAAAKPFLEAFDSSKPHERTCLGHKDRILGCQISHDGKYLATASQDATVRIWSVHNHKLVATLSDFFRKDYEVLRVAWASPTWAQDQRDDLSTYLLATGGADGQVHLLACQDVTQWTLCATLDHASYSHFEPENDDDTPQTYALHFINHWSALPGHDDANSFLLTSSDDHLHLWEVDASKKSKTDHDHALKKIHLREVFSLCFQDLHKEGYGVQIGQVTGSASVVLGTAPTSEDASPSDSPDVFGGARNPKGLIYVFDAVHCPSNGLLGVALSDGSLRLMNGRGVCLSVLTLPGQQTHLTSLAWDEAGVRLATCVANGVAIVWTFSLDEHNLKPQCQAILQGGHTPGCPLFGTTFCGENQDVLLSWGMDSRLCLWDAESRGDIDAPIATLLEKDDYPIYALDMKKDTIAVCGGGSEGGFLGIPCYLYDLPYAADEALNQDSKRAKTDTSKS